MLETMIALLVLSIGLIGVASLQGRGQQFNHAAYVRTQAAFLAYDIMDRMRANQDNLDSNGNADDGGYKLAKDTCAETTIDCDQGACEPSKLTVYDLSKWCLAVADSLPLGSATIDWDKNKQMYTIKIQWTEDRSEKAKMKSQSWNIVP